MLVAAGNFALHCEWLLLICQTSEKASVSHGKLMTFAFVVCACARSALVWMHGQ